MKCTLHSLRKAVCLLVMLALLVVPMTLCVHANEPAAFTVFDDAGLLTEEQFIDLRSKAYDLSCRYQTDFVIVTVNSLNGKSPAAFAGDFYDANNCGRGATRDGILMLIAMESRDYYFLTNGAVVGKITDGYGISMLEDKVVPYLSSGDYYAAFDAYLDTAASLIAAPATDDGHAVTSGRTDEFVYIGFDDLPRTATAEERWQCVGIFAVIGIVAGFVTTFVMKRGMKTARAQKFAMNYIRPGSFQLTRKQDLFLYRTRTRVRVQSSNSSHGGGSRGGGSRGGGGGKF